MLDRDYATQRTVYALAALRDGAPRVDVAYCFLERPGEPVVRGYTAADADALAEQVVSLARGVLDERYEVTERPHRELCADCPGRRALCSYSEERTLAPAGARAEGAERRAWTEAGARPSGIDVALSATRCHSAREAGLASLPAYAHRRWAAPCGRARRSRAPWAAAAGPS